ncbi:MAG: penicillin-binding protein activator [bacterium]
MKLKIFSVVAFFSLLLFCQSSKQLFEDGMNLMEKKDINAGRELLSRFVEEFPEDSNSYTALLTLIRTCTQQEFDEKVAYSEKLSELYPEDNQTHNIRVELSNTFIKKKAYFEAAGWLMQIVMFTDEDSETRTKAIDNLNKVIEKHLSSSELEYLLYNYNSDIFNPLILFRLYQLSLKSEEVQKSDIFRQRLIKDYPENDYTKKYIFEINNNKNSKCKIALLLQLTGGNAYIGEQVKRGCVIGNEEESIDLVMFDTDGSSVRTMELIDSIYADNTFVAVIGPMTSQETIVAGAYLYKQKNLPVLSPTASDGEILRFDTNIFLVNKTLVEEAIFTANYLSQDSSLQNIGIFFSDDSYGKTLSGAFKKEAKRLGLNVIFEIGYPAGTQDFLDKIELIEKMKIDAIYLPVSSEDAILLSTQLAFKDISALLVGGSAMYNENLIRLAKDYLKNTIIVAPQSLSGISDSYNSFRLKFFRKYSTDPDRFAALAYDTYKLLAMLIKNGYSDRKSIQNYLNSMESYEGASGKISFRKNRMDFDVFEIKNNEFIKKEK